VRQRARSGSERTQYCAYPAAMPWLGGSLRGGRVASSAAASLLLHRGLGASLARPRAMSTAQLAGTVGFIGVGNMGGPMVANLAAVLGPQGGRVVIFDVNSAAAAEIANGLPNASVAGSVAEVASASGATDCAHCTHARSPCLATAQQITLSPGLSRHCDHHGSRDSPRGGGLLWTGWCSRTRGGRHAAHRLFHDLTDLLTGD
jgi:hypothetical protein